MNFKTVIKKSKRKSISIQVKNDLIVYVKTPNFMIESDIEKILLKHKSWIQKKLLEVSKVNSNKEKISLSVGGKSVLFGRIYPIEFFESDEKIFLKDDKFYISSYDFEKINFYFKEFYKKSLQRYLEDRVDFFAKKMSLNYNRFKITSAKNRWGSCNSNGNLCFSLMLACVDKTLIDYVIVHELSHLVFHNHSNDFYSLVAKNIKNHLELREKLKNSLTF